MAPHEVDARTNGLSSRAFSNSINSLNLGVPSVNANLHAGSTHQPNHYLQGLSTTTSTTASSARAIKTAIHYPGDHNKTEDSSSHDTSKSVPKIPAPKPKSPNPAPKPKQPDPNPYSSGAGIIIMAVSLSQVDLVQIRRKMAL